MYDFGCTFVWSFIGCGIVVYTIESHQKMSAKINAHETAGCIVLECCHPFVLNHGVSYQKKIELAVG